MVGQLTFGGQLSGQAFEIASSLDKASQDVLALEETQTLPVERKFRDGAVVLDKVFAAQGYLNLLSVGTARGPVADVILLLARFHAAARAAACEVNADLEIKVGNTPIDRLLISHVVAEKQIMGLRVKVARQ